MKRVELKKISIHNFKGIKQLEVDFTNDLTQISGKNGLGKSSIYNAYLWCLFGKGQDGTTISPQPRDTNNNIVHKIYNVVELLLDVDGEKIKISRLQREDWSVPRGKSEEVFKGNVVERYINDVPLSVKEFEDKLNAICNVNDWYMLSSINAFMSLKQEDRRKKLISLSGDITVDLSKYPNVKKALAEGKTLDEYSRKIKTSKSKLQSSLDMMPARIDQQSKMIVEYEFEVFEKQAQSKENELKLVEEDIIKSDNTVVIKAYEQQLKAVENTIDETTRAINRKYDKKGTDIENEISRIDNEIKKVKQTIEYNAKEVAKHESRYNEYQIEFDECREQWKKKNDESYVDNISDKCSLCGSLLPESQIQEARLKARNAFNEAKVAEMLRLQRKAETIKKDQKELQMYISKANEEISDCKIKEEELVEKLCSLKKELNEISSLKDGEINNDKQLAEARKNKVEIEKKIADSKVQTSADKVEKRDSLKLELKEIIGKLSQRQVNQRCRELIKDLEQESKILGDEISKLMGIEQEIHDYKKERIEITERNVSQYFDMVKWKMYEPNITNDGEKEICQAVIEGKSYEEQNTATKVNAGIDIIGGISKAMDISLPLFVDNCESVNEVKMLPNQMVTLNVTRDETLTIN